MGGKREQERESHPGRKGAKAARRRRREILNVLLRVLRGET
jgi:hypothetical protein